MSDNTLFNGIKDIIKRRIEGLKKKINNCPPQPNTTHIPDNSSKPAETQNNKLPFMSSIDDWLCVHTTNYPPQKNNDGNLCIETSAKATDYRVPRSTIHFTLNHVVTSHQYGNWDDAKIVILAPFKDVVKKNSNPEMVYLEDTYFEPDPDKGLLLPESSYIIRPRNDNDKLFEIDEHGATYKTDNYTKEEEEFILSLDCLDKEKFHKLLNGDIENQNVNIILNNDKRLINAYNASKDKKAFIRGVFEEDRFVILNKLLRNYVIEKAAINMNFQILEPSLYYANRVLDAGEAAGFKATTYNCVHYNSIEGEMEHASYDITRLVNTLKTKDINKIYKYLIDKHNLPMHNEVIQNITDNKQIPDVYDIFNGMYKTTTVAMNEGLETYKPNLHKTIMRYSQRINSELELSLKELKQSENYSLIQSNLKSLVAQQNQKILNRSLER